MMLAFLADPGAAPGDACLSDLDLPKFVVPGEGTGDIELEPYTDETFGISGVIPVGWQEVNPGVFSRASSGLDVAIILAQAAPMSAETLLAVLVGQLGLEEDPEIVGEREANGIAWMLYYLEVQGLSVDIALADSEGTALLVLLQSEPAERDLLYDAVFVPAVDALVTVE
jgi:hypothetical protein